ncbi:M3 family oligoendopeptidase [Alicyclobacillus fastidiosus]|uniref:M3 family oligoendopeptidase n=1 Tax=Alicyclobacillus fastidiosus TaxID=392011 RepID=A0ABV5AKX6_9BACL|nr:M3 family oligoendopeptidase [Alicyclobacillus fastidiosus]WEH10194.1 M3 family oligoendopeptidase [Alicyclobacillus fastidiosus]
MRFREYVYERPDMDAVERRFQGLVEELRNASSADEQHDRIEELLRLRNRLSTLSNLVEVRNSIDTRDEFYKAEKQFFDQNSPRIEALNHLFYEALVDSPFQSELERRWGKQLLRVAEVTLKTFRPDVMEDLQRENELTSQYLDLMASAEIEFAGETRTLAQMTPFESSPDRAVRIRATKAKWSFFEQHRDELDGIYDELVKVRTRIAHKLGYDNFVELGYLRMTRTDYDEAMVANFRKQVRELIVPLATKLRERQRARIGVDHLHYYDEELAFLTGNPEPKGDPAWIVERARQMYDELSPETREFFQFMLDAELLDLVAKRGKAVGGFCTTFRDYEAPFIFSNFNGTHGDVTVLTHEAGHAFQAYASRSYAVPEYAFPTSEAAEIHSMSMEFFTWPWMDLFFEQDTEKFKFMHLSDALLFIPYGVAVDEFQHFVYANPEATPAQRKAAWRQIERTYLPHRDYDDNAFLEEGGYWQRQLHIYMYPFYYIDYTLAQICAFQYWVRAEENRGAAWRDYLEICKVGGSQSFLEIVDTGGLRSPFADGCVASVIGQIEAWLDRVDDSQF